MDKSNSVHYNIILYLTIILELIIYTYERFTLRKNYEQRNIKGLIAVVTGANSGIGKSTAFELAKRGATVILACRNLNEGQKVIHEIENKHYSGKLDLIELDLGDLSSVRKFASSVKIKYPRIDILVNNAGIFDTSGNWMKTTNGFESHMGVNYLGHFLLTNLLLDHIKKGTSSRIINVSSTIQIFARSYFDMNDLMLKKLKDWSLFNAIPYGLSKYYISLFAKELNQKLKNDMNTDNNNIISCSCCPGYVKTGLFRHSSLIKQLIVWLSVQLFGISSEQGCETIIYLCVSTKNPIGGKFYRTNKLHNDINQNLPDSIAAVLWEESAKLVQL